MKTLTLLAALFLSVTSVTASADWGRPPPPPGWGNGDRGGPGQGGPGWGGDRGGPGWGGPGWGGDRGGDRGGPGWGGGHGGPGQGGPGWGGGGGQGPGQGGPGWGGGHGPGGPGQGGPGWGQPPQQREQYVTCSSGGYNLSNCPVNGQIQSARVVNQLSSSSCQLGSSFGWQGNVLWVNRGCRATFVVYTY